VPLFDVQTALDIATRGVLELPSYISSFAPDLQPPPGRREQLVAECNALVLQLFQSVQLPAGLRLLHVRVCLLLVSGANSTSLTSSGGQNFTVFEGNS
jgi:hypothetical protein